MAGVTIVTWWFGLVSLTDLCMNNDECILCGNKTLKSTDRYYVKTDGSTLVSQIIANLPDNLQALLSCARDLEEREIRRFCCRQCKKLLEKFQKNLENLKKSEEDIITRSRERKSCAKELFKPERQQIPLASTPRADTPTIDQAFPGALQPEFSPIVNPVSSKPTTELGVKIVVTWPSQKRQRVLNDCLDPLGKAMLRGTWKDIARAAFKVKEIKAELLKCFMKEISNECAALTSKTNPTVLQNVTTEGIRDLSLSKIDKELKERTPTFHSILASSALSSRSSRRNQDLTPAVPVAASVLLKERCQRVNGFQLMLTTILKYTGFQSMCAFLSALKIGVTATYSNTKCDEFGSTFNERILVDKKEEEEALKMHHSPDLQNGTFGPGWKIAFDNFDIHQKVREMTEENQNKDWHWINHVKISNRVSDNNLPDDKPILDCPSLLENAKIAPSVPEIVSQHNNYIKLVSRVLVEEIPCLDYCKDSVVYHIPHKHTSETSKKSEKECLGMIFKNENTTEGITETLKEIHANYVPGWTSEDETKHFVEVGLVGDELSIERGVNSLLSLSNGFTAEERLDGIHLEIADWHTDLKFLDLIYNRFYSTASANDKCTIFSERNLINRRNVKTDTHHSYSANKQMFLLSLKSRIVVAAMHILGMDTLDGKPTKLCFPSNKPKDIENKRRYINKVTSLIVDTYVVDSETYNGIINSILNDEEQGQIMQNQMNAEGRFPCRHPGCQKTFKYNGKHLRNHEAQVHGLIIEDPQPCTDTSSEIPKTAMKTDETKVDDMYNYQCNLMEHGLLYMNFIDGISEGDGDRILRCWKFLLLHFYADKQGSTKYALEALFLQFQQQALLTPRQAHQQRWNRGVNNSGHIGKNVPLDLEVEHNNNTLKEALRKMGSNLTPHAVNRAAKMLKMATETIDKVAKECYVMKRSGKHFVKSTKKDLAKIVESLQQQKALVSTPGRSYAHYENFRRSHLTNHMGGFCKRINKHKYQMVMYTKAR